MSLETIETLTAEFAAERDVLAAVVQQLQDEQEATKRRLMPAIMSAVAATVEAQAKLKAEVEGSKSLFKRPKTRIMNGIKIGFAKQKGTLTISDPAQTVKLIKKHFPDQADILIKTEEKPAKTPLAALAASLLKKVGVTMTDATDAIVIKPMDGEIDKLVDALTKDSNAEAESSPD